MQPRTSRLLACPPAPTVNAQADCPEDVPAYIHRVGRTARYTHAGRGLLLLLPSEREGMLKQASGGVGVLLLLEIETGVCGQAGDTSPGVARLLLRSLTCVLLLRLLTCVLPGAPRTFNPQLEAAKVPIKQAHHNPAKVQPIGPALQALLSKDTELKVGWGRCVCS